MIDKKKLIKSLIIISLIIIIIITTIQIRKTLARYETVTTGERDVDVAFWIVDNSFESQRLYIKDIYPAANAFEYTFTVSNFEGDDIAETDMEYDLIFTTTTNLPLVYEIVRKIDGNTKTETLHQELYQDSDGTTYRKMKFGTNEEIYPLKMDTIDNTTNNKRKITDTYTLKVTFPLQVDVNGETVNNRDYSEYADLMEDVNVQLTARQVVKNENRS